MSAKNIDRFKNAFIAIVLAGALVAVGAHMSRAATPGIISYQGRILVSNAPFSGTGQFNFALVDNAGTTTFWSNDNTSTAGSQPTATVSLPVTNGLYSVYLGDTTIPNMTNAIPATVFANGIVKLRVWFNDGTNGSKLLAPDQRIVPVGYAMTAAAVDTGAITSAMIAPGVIPTNLPPSGAAGGDLTGTYPSPTIATGAVSTAKIVDGAVTPSKLSGYDSVSVGMTSTLSINENATSRLPFNLEYFDSNNLHDNSTNPSRITIAQPGRYLIVSTISMVDSTGSTGEVRLNLYKNYPNTLLGAVCNKPAMFGRCSQSVTVVAQLTTGDFIETEVFNNATQGTITVETGGSTFTVTRLP